jgi:hypothetical protein
MAIVERYLSMRERFREEHAGTPFLSSVSSEAELCKVVTDGLNGIEELEQRGKLAGVPDYIAVTPREPT